VVSSANTNANKRLKIWLKSFIPSDLEGLETVSGTGEHAGKTMLPSPGPIKACFLTDQRGFSSDIDASARTHSQIEIDLGTASLIGQQHHCCETIQVDCDDGAEKCRDVADHSQMEFTNFTVSEAERTIQVDLQGSARNPCFEVANIKLSPNLDYKGVISITLDETKSSATIFFEGNIEPYPAFEMYLSLNGGAPYTLFQHPALPGSTPIDLVGSPQREIRHEITITL
jgi:hypothetical protein